MGHPFGHLPRVDEDQGGAVAARVLGDAVEDVRHLAAAHDGLELGRGQLNGHIQVAGVAAVDDHRRRPVVVHAGEQPRHQVERPLGGGEADALEAAPALADRAAVQPLEGQRQVAAPFVVGQRVCTSSTITVRTPRRSARDEGAVRRRVERLRRRDEQVGRLLLHRGALGLRRVPRADGDAQARVGVAEAGAPPGSRSGGRGGSRARRPPAPAAARHRGPRACPMGPIRPRGAVGGIDGDQEARVRVLPEPVGEATRRTSLPAAMWGQAADCGGVGPAGKRRANQLATAGWKSVSGPGNSRGASVTLPFHQEVVTARGPPGS